VSCDFLDIVPDEKEKAEDAFEDVRAAERYLYSCYSYLPNPREGPVEDNKSIARAIPPPMLLTIIVLNIMKSVCKWFVKL
ncbi:hypothetical protein, partial [Vibrio cholerae]|uniref:hypothetical protein n=1 Tax=Vibrio cholerae TaxID=666 RepID=UPI001C127043